MQRPAHTPEPVETSQLPMHELLALEAVSRLGSLRSAAEALHVTASGMSHRIGSLERRTGLVLLHRHGRGVVLSDDAKAMVQTLRERLTGLSQTTEALRSAELSVVRIATAVAVGAVWLLPRLQRFAAAHSNPDFEVLTVATADELPTDRWDLQVHYGDGPRRGSLRHLLFEDRIVALCSPRLARRDGAELRALRLSQIDSARGYPGRVAVAHRGSLLFDDALTMLEAAVSGAGVAYATETSAGPYLSSGALVRASETTWPGNVYYLDLSPAGQRKPGARAVRDYLLADLTRP